MDQHEFPQPVPTSNERYDSYTRAFSQQQQPPPPFGVYPHGPYASPEGQHPPPQGQPPQGQYPQGQYPPQGQPPHRQYPQQNHYGPQGVEYGYAPTFPEERQYAPPQGAPGYGPPQGQYPTYNNPLSQPNVYTRSFEAGPTPGYAPGDIAKGDASQEADALRKAMKGFGTDELTLIEILSTKDAMQMALLTDTFNKRHKRDLQKDLRKELSGKLEKVLVTLVRGPLIQDVYAVRDAVKGIGTNEALLTDVLVGRTNADLKAIKQAYSDTFSERMEAAVRGDLSMATEQLYNVIMSASRNDESMPIDKKELDQDIHNIYGATTGNMGVEQMVVCRTLALRSNAQIRAIHTEYKRNYNVNLEDAIRQKFSGHMKDTLLAMIYRAVDSPMHDAVSLEACMAGIGTKNDLLTERVVRIHWSRQRGDAAKRAYMNKYGKSLRSRIAGETSGDFEKALLAMLG